MSDSYTTTATPETTNAAPTAHPPVRESQRSVEAEVEQGAIAGQQVMRAIGGGSPAAPPDRFASALGQMQSASGQAGMLRQLQRSYGNSYVGRVIQAKLTVNQPGDVYEQEADRMAAQVMTMAAPQSAPSIQREMDPKKEKEKIQMLPMAAPQSAPSIQREMDPKKEKEKIQMLPLLQRATEGSQEAGANLESQLNSSKGGGSSLSDDVRSFMEPRFGADFSQVRAHTDSEAVQMNRDLNAQAFTHRQDVYFGAGKSPAKDALTAHELTHVVQQTGQIQPQPTQTLGSSIGLTPSSGEKPYLIQRDPTTPAPAGPFAPPLPSPPLATGKQGIGENEPVSLPPVGASLQLVLSAAERRFPLTKEDLSEFNLGVGELSTPNIPLGKSGITAKFTVGADNPVRLADVSLVLSPLIGLLDAGQVDAARASDEHGNKLGKEVGAVVGGAIGAVVGGVIGSAIGEKAGASVGSAASEELAGDHFIRLTLDQGTLGGHFMVTYNPFLTLELSAIGLSWLLGLKATLQTNLNLSVVPKIDFKGSSVTLIFRAGRLSHSKFELKPVITPVLNLLFDANGQLLASANILSILGGDEKSASPDDVSGVELVEIVTAPFKLLQWGTLIGGQPDLRAAKGSPFEILKAGMKGDPGSITTSFQDFIVKSDKEMPFSKPPTTDGTPRTGLTEDQAIPLVWKKKFDKYLQSIPLPSTVFGKRHPARPFPHKVYESERRAISIELGVNIWPYVGMTLRKKGNERGSEVKRFREDLENHGIFLDPMYQIDHVIDLVFETGSDSADNLWPLKGDINVLAGGMWSNGKQLVEWSNKKGDPPTRTAPSAVPVGRWFVISNFEDPT